MLHLHSGALNYNYAVMKQYTALIIDDEQDICLLLINFFKKNNVRAFFSTTLKEGRHKFEEYNPDLLILDHNLPDGYGIDSIKNFKKDHPNLQVVVISAQSNLKNNALHEGADFFMEKPISFSKLNALVKSNVIENKS